MEIGGEVWGYELGNSLMWTWNEMRKKFRAFNDNNSDFSMKRKWIFSLFSLDSHSNSTSSFLLFIVNIIISKWGKKHEKKSSTAAQTHTQSVILSLGKLALKVMKRRLKIGIVAAVCLSFLCLEAIEYWSETKWRRKSKDKRRWRWKERFNGGKSDGGGRDTWKRKTKKHEINISKFHPLWSIYL